MEEALVDVEYLSPSRACDRSAGTLKFARAGYRGCQQNHAGDERRLEDGTRTRETIKRDGGDVALLRDDAISNPGAG